MNQASSFTAAFTAPAPPSPDCVAPSPPVEAPTALPRRSDKLPLASAGEPGASPGDASLPSFEPGLGAAPLFVEFDTLQQRTLPLSWPTAMVFPLTFALASLNRGSELEGTNRMHVTRLPWKDGG